MDFWNGRDFSAWNNGGNGGNNGNGQSCNFGGNDSRSGNGEPDGYGTSYGAYQGDTANGDGTFYGNGSGYTYGFGNDGSSDGAPDKRQFESKFNEYKTKSEDELMSELLKTAGKMKADGRFDPAELENFFGKTSGFLNSEQRAKLRGLIDMLK